MYFPLVFLEQTIASLIQIYLLDGNKFHHVFSFFCNRITTGNSTVKAMKKTCSRFTRGNICYKVKFPEATGRDGGGGGG